MTIQMLRAFFGWCAAQSNAFAVDIDDLLQFLVHANRPRRSLL